MLKKRLEEIAISTVHDNNGKNFVKGYFKIDDILKVFVEEKRKIFKLLLLIDDWDEAKKRIKKELL